MVKDLPAETKAAAIESYKSALRAVFLYNLGLSVLLILLVLPIKASLPSLKLVVNTYFYKQEYPLPGSEDKDAVVEEEE